ncbi:probable mitochondrial-processing peptidase subunit beta, mitochondrial isoform X2 [Asparagus officinalis]|uniref:probable mitochondrial-processing peptidase subunit beta, mitochondrial isoform X2 n=1 Tax=Asparagus officinalis TaxID=4686 RepID=UPI00098E51BA|nr:probable mitochondrial-processing peptidase subunit beta, mitochondrial isoform X2 [Asparagus officinalis]
MASQLSQIKRKLTTLSSPTLARFLSLATTPFKEPISSSPPSPDPRFIRHTSQNPNLADHSPFFRFPPTKTTTLPNGIRVTTQTAPSSAIHTASIGVWIDAGSRYEAPGTNGTAHFLEHMIFKGTSRRTARSLEEEIENMGARLNAYTSREQTTFFADVQSKDLPFAVDVLADILQNSRFPEYAIQRERGVILREMEEVQGQMEEVIFDYLHMAAFHGHPLGDTILGPEENIRAIDRVDLQRYILTHYSGHRMVVSAAGAVNHEEIVNMISRSFKNFSEDPATADQLVKSNPAIFTNSQITVEDKDIRLLHLAIAFKGAAWTDPNSIPLMVLQSLLGAWNRSIGVGNCSGSQLACRVSTDNLAESMMSFNTNYNDTGLFGVYSTSPPDSVETLSTVIMEELRRLAYQVSEEEVLRARNQSMSECSRVSSKNEGFHQAGIAILIILIRATNMHVDSM